MRGMLYVDASSHGTNQGLGAWLDLALSYARSLPAKPATTKKQAKK
jgi:hypothetical protein